MLELRKLPVLTEAISGQTEGVKANVTGDTALELGGGHVVGAKEDEELEEAEGGGGLEGLEEVLGGEVVVPLVKLLHEHTHHRQHSHSACDLGGEERRRRGRMMSVFLGFDARGETRVQCIRGQGPPPSYFHVPLATQRPIYA